nr:insulinase family protein [Treponema sp.]
MKNYISILFSLLFFFCISNINSQESASILENRLKQLKVYTLENGLESYVLQDSGTALVHIQFTVKAGFSEQKPETTGFFQLCTSLLSSNGIEGECNSDSAVYKITTTPENIEKSLELIAKQFSNPYFSDDNIARQLNNIKEQSEALTQTAAGFINSVIYEKIFKEEPWRHDTGIYGAIYEYSKPSAVRTVLNSIVSDYYTPENSAIFISGNITASNIENLIRKYFSNWKATRRNENAKEHVSADTAIKESYILADNALSPKYVQLVTQYTNLSPVQAGILAAALSPLPYTYSNASVVQENGKARLILQALIIYDKSESVENISNSFNQYIENRISEVLLENNGAFKRAKVLLRNQMNRTFENAKGCMQELSSFWAIGNTKKMNLIQDFSNLFDEIANENQDSIKEALDKANRYSFTIINTSLAKKLATITRDYESWYVKYKKQQTEKRLSDTKDEKLFESENPKAQSYIYAMRERPTISTLMLKNDIAVTTKYNEYSSSA